MAERNDVQQQQPNQQAEADPGDALLNAFLGEEAAGIEDSKQFQRPAKSRDAEAGEPEEADAEAEVDEQEEGAEAEEAAGDEEAEAEAAEGEPQGDHVELPDGTKIAVADLISAHQFKTQHESQLESLRHNVITQAQQEVETQKQTWLNRIGESERVLEFLAELVPNYQRPPVSMLDRTSPDYDSDTYHYLNHEIDRIEGKKAEAIKKIQTMKQQRDAETGEQTQTRLKANAAKLVAARPEWGDPAKAKEKQSSITAALKQHYGLDDETIASVVDYRFFLMAEDAAAYRALKSKAKPTPKGEQPKAPRLVRSAAKPGPKATQTRRVKDAQKTLEKTGKVTDREAIFGRFVD